MTWTNQLHRIPLKRRTLPASQGSGSGSLSQGSSPVQNGQKGRYLEGLQQQTQVPALFCDRPDMGGILRGHKNNRNANTHRPQSCVEFYAAHLRHVHIQNETIGCKGLNRVEEFFCGVESPHLVAEGSKHAGKGFDDRSIIIHQRHKGFALFGHLFGMAI